ncbi:MAG: hypothetical protein LBD48_01025 [Treponema sp.]|jgi:hypothetical protein|nr:hypothetical protein [Treponema sp.]
MAPVISLSTCERSEKERVIRLDAYALTIVFSVPENPESELHYYAYATAVEKALGENMVLGEAVSRAVLIGEKYLAPKKPHCGDGWEIVLTVRVTLEVLPMPVNGCDCSIVIKTQCMEMGVPYAVETLREAYSLLQEEAAIEGDGACGAIRKNGGVIGCVVTPLSIGTAPLLLYLAMGTAGLPLLVSETRNVYKIPITPCANGRRGCF